MTDEAILHHSRDGKCELASGEFLSDQQLADMLGVTTRTTLRWRRDGAGPKYVRAGLRRVLYRRADVLAWAASRTFPTLAAETVARTA
jgi:predicted DNA-binding transcriptional regulator AlpA